MFIPIHKCVLMTNSKTPVKMDKYEAPQFCTVSGHRDFNFAQFPDTAIFKFLTQFHDTEMNHKDSTACVIKAIVPVFTWMNFKFFIEEVWQHCIHGRKVEGNVRQQRVRSHCLTRELRYILCTRRRRSPHIVSEEQTGFDAPCLNNFQPCLNKGLNTPT